MQAKTRLCCLHDCVACLSALRSSLGATSTKDDPRSARSCTALIVCNTTRDNHHSALHMRSAASTFSLHTSTCMQASMCFILRVCGDARSSYVGKRWNLQRSSLVVSAANTTCGRTQYTTTSAVYNLPHRIHHSALHVHICYVGVAAERHHFGASPRRCGRPVPCVQECNLTSLTRERGT